MNILLTGGSGFVGRRFLDIASSDWHITTLGRTKLECSNSVICDLSDKISVSEVANVLKDSSFDAIVHLAAFVPKTAEEDTIENAVAGNITATVNLLEFFGDRAPKIIFGSTAEVYDQSMISGEITEANAVKPYSYYGATKLSSEFIMQSFAAKNNKELSILRFSVMYGGFDSIARAIPNFIRAALNSETITICGAEVLRDYVHIDDVAKSIMCAITSQGSGVLNIGTGRGVSIYDAAKEIVNSTDSCSKIDIRSAAGGVDIVLNIEKAKKSIGYEPSVLFPAKLKKMIDEYRK